MAASPPTREAIETYMSITGSSESQARLKLQEYGGNLNEAVNAHFSEGNPHSANPTFGSSPQYDSTNMTDQTRAGQRGLMPILSAVRSFRPSLLLDPNYRRNLFNRFGSSSPIAPAPNAQRPVHAGEVPVDRRSTNEHYGQSGVRPNFEDVYGTAVPHYPQTHARLDDHDAEEEMIQAAIEASRQEVLSGSGASHSQHHLDDEQLAHALSLSVQTAEEEKAVREMQMKENDERWRAYRGGETSERSSRSGFQATPDTLSVQDRLQNPGQQLPLNKSTSVAEDHPQSKGDAFGSDEWGGISPKELNEAIMLEAAVFGGNPGSTSNFSSNATRIKSCPNVNPSPQPIPRPPSPSLVEQRRLREQQDNEYLKSLLEDLRKESNTCKEAGTVSSKKEESNKKILEEEQLNRLLAAKEASLPLEPPSDDQNAITLMVRMPDGKRHGRRFLKSDKLQVLFDFIDVGKVVKPGTYMLVRPYPRRAFSLSDGSSTLVELGLTSKQEVLFLELT